MSKTRELVCILFNISPEIVHKLLPAGKHNSCVVKVHKCVSQGYSILHMYEPKQRGHY